MKKVVLNTHPRNRFLSNPYSFLNRPEGRKDNSCIYVFLYFLSTSHKDSTCISAPNSTLQYGGYGSCPKYLLPWLTTTVHLLTKVTRYKVPPFVSRCQPMGPLCLWQCLFEKSLVQHILMSPELEHQAESNFALQVLGGEERGGWSLACSLPTSHGGFPSHRSPWFLPVLQRDLVIV